MSSSHRSPRWTVSRLTWLVVLALCAPLAQVTAAFADDVTGTVTISGGLLEMSASTGPNFGTVGASLLPIGTTVGPVSIPIEVTDMRGTGAGWNLQITSTQFTTGGADPHTLPTTATKVFAVIGGCASGSLCIPAVPATLALPVTVPAGLSAPAPVKFFSALVPTGRGEMVLNPSFTLDVPANAFAGTYTSTMTITIAAGP